MKLEETTTTTLTTTTTHCLGVEEEKAEIATILVVASATIETMTTAADLVAVRLL